jgi:RNA polymerase sigma-70 factor (ECF subfamily)
MNQLRRKLAEGDCKAFSAIFNECSVPLLGFVRCYLGPHGPAEDVVQETLLQLWWNPRGFDPDRGTSKQYLFGIAHNKAAQTLRDSRKHESADTAEPVLRSGEAAAELDSLFECLHPDDRALLWLREVEGYTYDELAKILRVPQGTVKSRLFSAREGLRQAGRTRSQPKEGSWIA